MCRWWRVWEMCPTSMSIPTPTQWCKVSKAVSTLSLTGELISSHYHLIYWIGGIPLNLCNIIYELNSISYFIAFLKLYIFIWQPPHGKLAGAHSSKSVDSFRWNSDSRAIRLSGQKNPVSSLLSLRKIIYHRKRYHLGNANSSRKVTDAWPESSFLNWQESV